MNKCAISLAISLTLASTMFARGWTVSPTDSLGVNFTSLQKAIDSATAHDTLWLDHGNLSPGDVPLELRKPLVFIGRQANSTASSAFQIRAWSEASGSSFWGVNIGLHVNATCVSGIEVGYSTFRQEGCLEGAYVHHSHVTGSNNLMRSSRLQNNLMDQGSFLSGSIQNWFDHVTVDVGGIAGVEMIVSNSVLSGTSPYWPNGHWYQSAKESHYKNSLFWGIQSIELDNTAVGCKFGDSLMIATGPFSTGFHVKSAYATMSEDGTEPGIFGGKFPLRFVGNEANLIPLMPLPWLRTVALERLRVASSDSVKVSIEAIRGK